MLAWPEGSALRASVQGGAGLGVLPEVAEDSELEVALPADENPEG